MIQAGSLRTKIIIEVATDTTSPDDGSRVTTWAPLRTVYGSIQALTGSVQPYAASYLATATYKITTRYLAGIVPNDYRLNVNGKILAIIAALDPDGRRTELNFACTGVL